MLKIRLQRIGKRNSPAFRVVVTEKTTGPKGKSVEILGSYNPRLKTVSLKKERTTHWLNVGAQPSDSVHNLLIAQGVLTGDKIQVHKKKKGNGEQLAAAPAAPTAEAATPAVQEKAEEVATVPQEAVLEETPEAK